MAAGTFTFYNSFKERMAKGEIDNDGDVFKAILLDSGYTPNANADDDYADVSGDELSGNGYVAQTLIHSLSRSTDTIIFDADPMQWTADGGNIVARYLVIYDDTHASDALVGYVLLDSTPADVTVTDGNTLTVTPHANGIWRLQ